MFIHEYGSRDDELAKALGSERAVLCICHMDRPIYEGLPSYPIRTDDGSLGGRGML